MNTDWMEFFFDNIFPWLFGVILIGSLLFGACQIYLMIKAVDYVHDKGLKSVINQIWEGQAERVK